MKVAVIGAAGGLCSRVVAEALRRGHGVTALTEAAVDATDSAAVATLLAGHRPQTPTPTGPTSPLSARREAGLRTGHYPTRTDDELLVDADGRSYVSVEDIPEPILDEIKDPAHRGNSSPSPLKPEGRSPFAG